MQPLREGTQTYAWLGLALTLPFLMVCGTLDVGIEQAQSGGPDAAGTIAALASNNSSLATQAHSQRQAISYLATQNADLVTRTWQLEQERSALAGAATQTAATQIALDKDQREVANISPTPSATEPVLPLPTATPGGPSATAVPTDLPSPTPTATRTPTHTATPTATLTLTRSPTATPLPSNTPVPTSTPSRTATNTPTRTSTPTPTATANIWINDNFNNLSIGPLDLQAGWFTTRPDVDSAMVVQAAGDNKIVEIDPQAGFNVDMAKDVANQSSGRHTFSLRVSVTGATEPSLAKVEVRTTNAAGWDKKFQVFFGSSIRVNYSPSGAEVTVVPNTEPGRWYTIRTELNLATEQLDVWVGDQLAATGLPMHPGPITDLALWGWERAGAVSIDDVLGVQN